MRLKANGVEVYYEQWGDRQNPAVLCLHGWGCSVKHFEPIAKDLSRDYFVTVMDFPAHGQSEKPEETWGVKDFALCVQELMGKLEIIPCDVIAHSFGGRVALWLAANEPRLIKRLVLTGGAGVKKELTPEQQKRAEAFQRKKKMLLALKKVPGVGGVAEKSLEALRDKYGSADYKALDENMRKTFVQVINEDLRPLLPEIHASTLLIWGENDQDTPLWMGRVMEKEIPDAGLVIFENDDHYAYLRQWPRFVAVVRAFLT